MPFTLLWKLAPIILGFLLCTAAFVAGYKYSSALSDKEKADLVIENQKLMQEENKRMHDISLDYEKRLQEAKGNVKVVVKTIKTEVEKPVYKECIVPVSGVKILNDSVKSLNDTRVDQKINDEVEKLNSKRASKDEPK